jgi:uncharacterized protein involved in exopolysaccharide biosynthesis
MRAVNASVQVVKIGGEDERTSFIEVVCNHIDGDLAVKLVNGVTDAATEVFQEMLTKSVSANRKFLETQVAEYEAEINRNEQKLRDFLAGHPGFGQTDDDQSIATRKVQLDYSQSNLAAEVQGLETKIRITTDDLEAYRGGAITNIPPAVKADDNLEVLQNNLLSLQFDRAQHLGRYSEKHPVIQKLDSEIGKAREEIRDEVIRLLEEEIEIYKALKQEKISQLNSFRGTISELIWSTDDFAEARIEYNRLVQDLQIAQDIYGRMKTSLAEAVHEENKAKQRYGVEIIERAIEAQPRRELWFQPIFRITLAVIGGVFIALILAFFIEYINIKAVETAPPSGGS